MLPLLLHPWLGWGRLLGRAGDRDGQQGRIRPWDDGGQALPAPREDSPGRALGPALHGVWQLLGPRGLGGVWAAVEAPRVILGKISLQDISMTSVSPQAGMPCSLVASATADPLLCMGSPKSGPSLPAPCLCPSCCCKYCKKDVLCCTEETCFCEQDFKPLLVCVHLSPFGRGGSRDPQGCQLVGLALEKGETSGKQVQQHTPG